MSSSSPQPAPIPRWYIFTLLGMIPLAVLLAVFAVRNHPADRPGKADMGWRITLAQKDIAKWGAHPPESNNLSGLVRVEGDHYALVSDKGGNLLWGEIKVDAKTGAVASALVLPKCAHLPGCFDVEGCAVSPDRRTLVVSDETDSGLTEFPLDFGASGDLVQMAKATQLLKGFRNNLSLESLAAADDGSGYWTMNEDALEDDGPRASAVAGGWLRLLKVDLKLRPVRQWAYLSDPMPGTLPIPGAINGVSDILALPDGRLVVLERGFGVQGFRIRLYLVDPAAAAVDVTGEAHLHQAQKVAPLPKELLFEWHGWANFEGIAFGPGLAGGARSVLLVADDGDGISTPGLLALKLERVEKK